MDNRHIVYIDKAADRESPLQGYLAGVGSPRCTAPYQLSPGLQARTHLIHQEQRERDTKLALAPEKAVSWRLARWRPVEQRAELCTQHTKCRCTRNGKQPVKQMAHSQALACTGQSAQKMRAHHKQAQARMVL